jgi:acyl carrier protein
MLSLCKRILRRVCGSPRGLSQEAMDAATVSKLRARGVQIGAGCRIYSMEFSTEPYLVRLGDGVCIAGGVKFLTHDGAARLLRSRRAMIQSFGRIVVGDNSFIGENAILLPGTTIGRDCVIGAGAVVHGTIPDNSLAVPARSSTVSSAARTRLIRLACRNRSGGRSSSLISVRQSVLAEIRRDEDPMMSAADAVLSAIQEVAGTGDRPIAPDLLLDEDLGIDSLDFVRLIQLVEERLDIVISDEAAAAINTVGELIALAGATVDNR